MPSIYSPIIVPEEPDTLLDLQGNRWTDGVVRWQVSATMSPQVIQWWVNWLVRKHGGGATVLLGTPPIVMQAEVL